jgi:F0F1-type ATP synthase membrane subunit a
MTTLVSVILNIVSFDITAQINCQVSFVLHVLFVILLDQLYSQGLGYFLIRAWRPPPFMLQRPVSYPIFFRCFLTLPLFLPRC